MGWRAGTIAPEARCPTARFTHYRQLCYFVFIPFNGFADMIPASLLLPPNRLLALLEHSLKRQVSECQFHNTHQKSFSLLQDHICPMCVPPALAAPSAQLAF